MSLVFAGTKAGELGGVFERATNATFIDTNFVSEGVRIPNNSRQAVVHRATVGTVWYSFQIGWEGINDSNADGYMLDIRDAAGNILFRWEISNGDLAPFCYGPGTASGTYNFSPVRDIRYKIDIELAVDPATGTTASIYVNNALSQTVTDSGAHSRGQPVMIDFVNADTSSSGSAYTYISELVIRDNGESTLGRRLYQLDPNAVGNYDQWENNHDALDLEDLTFMNGGDAERQSWTHAAYAGPAPAAFEDVVFTGKPIMPAAGPNRLDAFTRISGVDYSAGPIAPTLGMTESWSFPNNPATAGAWDLAAINALELGVQPTTV